MFLVSGLEDKYYWLTRTARVVSVQHASYSRVIIVAVGL